MGINILPHEPRLTVVHGFHEEYSGLSINLLHLGVFTKKVSTMAIGNSSWLVGLYFFTLHP